MTAPPRLPDYLRHMHEAAQTAMHYMVGMNLATFLTDSRTQQAVFFDFVIPGEAAAKLMASHPEFLARHPRVPWRGIRDMRKLVAHGYFTIDTDVLWRTVQHALPDLLAAIIDAADKQVGVGSQPPAAASLAHAPRAPCPRTRDAVSAPPRPAMTPSCRCSPATARAHGEKPASPCAAAPCRGRRNRNNRSYRSW